MTKLSTEESALFELMRTHSTTRNLSGMNQMMVHYENIKRLFADFAPITESTSTSTQDPNTSNMAQQVVALKLENNQINQELKITVETMNSVIGEYSMMFSQKEDLEELQESRKRVVATLDKFCAAHDITPAANDPAEAAFSTDEDHGESPDAQALAANS